MPSLVPGYEYDIFISYRQNDNRSGWVTEFVKALQEELAATIKDPVSVYFDSNPHDGLLETHNVDKSLEGKLKCLIFIPILSQTYCDPKSFAWQSELCAFNRMAKDDKLGRDVKLVNGNVASRILPVKVHDLDEIDKELFEKETGGVLRALEFIYKEPGVNRPLKKEDRKEDNLCRTSYGNQVNKVANAIKEIYQATGKAPASRAVPGAAPSVSRPMREVITLASIVFLALSILALLQYERLMEALVGTNDQSIAVLPFTDMSPNKDMEYLGDGLAEEIINVLAQSRELKVIARTSSFQFKGKMTDLRKVGEDLGVAAVLEGSVRSSGNMLRITAQLIETGTGSHLWSQTFDRSPDDILKVELEIARAVAAELRGKLLGKEEKHTRNPKVHSLALQANFIVRTEQGFYNKAMDLYQRALVLDSSDANLWSDLSAFYTTVAGYPSMAQAPITTKEALERARRAAERGIELDRESPQTHLALGNVMRISRDWKGAESEFSLVLQIEPDNLRAKAGLASIRMFQCQLESAIKLQREVIQLDPVAAGQYRMLALAYFFADSLEKSIATRRRSEELEQSKFFNRSAISITLTLMGRFDEAEQELRLEQQENWRMHAGAYLEFAKGNRKESDRLLSDIKVRFPGMAFQVADTYAYRGEVDSAFQWLDRAFEISDSGLVNAQCFPSMRKLHADPRWAPLMKRIGFSQN